MIKNILNTLMFLIVLYLAILLTSSGIWLLLYVELFVILGLVKLSRNDVSWSIIFLVAGTVATDIFSFQTVGLTALFIILSLLIFRLVARFVAILDNQSRGIKVILAFAVFYLINGLYYYGQNVLDFGQIVWVGISNILILLMFLVISSFIKRSNNAFKV